MMSFPRNLRRETFFVRFPNGEIELLTGPALEQAFHSGLADAHTSIRSVNSSVWTTLGEAASLWRQATTTSWSLAPIELDRPADPMRQSRVFDPAVFQPLTRRAARAIATGVGALAVAGIVALGTWLGQANKATLGAGAAAARAIEAAPVMSTAGTRTVAETLHPTDRANARTRRREEEQDKQLLQQDAVRQWKQAITRGRSRTTSSTSLAPPPGWEALKGTSRFDPLDGAL